MKPKKFSLAVLVVLFTWGWVAPALGQWHCYNGHSYALTDFGDWDEAEATAILAGGHLVTVNSSEENEWLYNTFYTEMSTYGAWIGLYQDTDDPAYSEPAGGWKWISGEPVTFTGWYGQEPNDLGGGEDWAVLELAYPPLQWNDLGPDSSGYPEGGIPGIVEITDCNCNGVADDHDVASGTSQDCNGNAVPDECDIADGTSQDANGNGVPDECECDGCICIDRLIVRFQNNKLIAKLVTNAPGGATYRLTADGAFYRDMTIGSNGKGSVNWTNPVPGEHQVCVDGCDMCETITCP